MQKEMIKYSTEKNRDFSMIKICDTCKKKYYPRKNGYQSTSRFCSAKCSRMSRKK